MALKDKFNFDTDPLYLMDGNAFIFRGFFANPHMTRTDSFPTGAMHIVGRIVLRILKEEQPKHFVFVLDGKGPHFRHKLFPAYKAQRPPVAEALLAQFAPIKSMISSFGIHVETSQNCEADDCIASLAERFSKERPVVMIGMDKDLRQCLKENVIMWDPASKEEKILTEASFREETGLNPNQWADVQALIGDSSDNIPGVRGIGDKTAIKIFQDFPTLEDIRDRFDDLPLPVKKKMEGNLEEMFLFRKLTTLGTEYCTNLDLGTVTIQPSHEQNTLTLLKEYELNSIAKSYEELIRKDIIHILPNSSNHGNLLQEIPHEKINSDTQNNDSPQADTAPIEINFVKSLPDCKGKVVAVFPTELGMHINLSPLPKSVDFLYELSIKDSTDTWETNPQATEATENPPPKKLPQANTNSPAHTKKTSNKNAPQQGSLFALLEEKSPPKTRNLIEEAAKMLLLPNAGHTDFLFTGDMEDLIPYIKRAAHVVVCELKNLFHTYPILSEKLLDFKRFFDISIGAWLLSPDEKDYSWTALFPLHAEKIGQTAHIALSLYEQQLRLMDTRHLQKLMLEIEMPLVPVLYSMEKIGIQINVGELFTFLDEVRLELEKLTTSIYDYAGGPFNIRSAQQISDVLFKRLNLPAGKSTKAGQASTSHAVLEQLSGTHPLIDALQEYRKLEKLRSTYLEPLPRVTGQDGRIRTTFNQNATATGRLSSSNPNLQNIPIRGELGKRMRHCFTAKPHHLLVSADYSQVELRVLAHFSGDETLRQAFLQNEDIHSRTAALLYDTKLENVTTDMRRHAKTINFGLLYGMGPRKLSQDLSISFTEAKRFIEVYFNRFHQIKSFYDEVEQSAREHAFVTTLSGRQRALPDIMSDNHQAKALAERQAVNTLIQGSAADIIKLAMLAVNNDSLLKEWNAKLLLQIHDELILEVPHDYAQKAGQRMADIMMNIAPNNKHMSVPLLVDFGFGLDWGNAH